MPFIIWCTQNNKWFILITASMVLESLTTKFILKKNLARSPSLGMIRKLVRVRTGQKCLY